MASLVLLAPRFVFSFASPAATVDLSCYTVAVELVTEQEEIDIGNYCNAGAVDIGRVTFTCSATMLWEPALPAILGNTEHARKVGTVAITPDPANFTGDTIQWQGAWATKGIHGRFEVGQRVEFELPVSVLTPPAWVVTP